MKISQRLIGNTLLAAGGIAAVAAVGLVSVTSIQTDIDELTSSASPLQAKTLEAQERAERSIGLLLRQSTATDQMESDRIGRQVDDTIADMRRLTADMQKLGGRIKDDSGALAEARNVVAKAVKKKIDSTAQYRHEAQTIGKSLEAIEQQITSVRNGVQKNELDANVAADAAQTLSAQYNQDIKMLLSVQSRLKELQLILTDLDEVKNKFRFGPLKERIKATGDGIQSELNSRPNHALAVTIRTTLTSFNEALVREPEGLFHLRSEALAGKDGGGHYARARKAAIAMLDEVSSKMANAVDSQEMQTVRQREQLTAALKARADAVMAIGLSSTIGADVKDIVARVRLIMLAGNADELAEAARQLQAAQGRAIGNIDALRGVVGRKGVNELVRSGDTALAAVQGIRAAVEKLVAGRKGVLDAENQVAEAIRKLKQFSIERAAQSEAGMKEIGKRQADTVAGVNEQVGFALMAILIISATVIGIALFISLRITRSISGPLGEAAAAAQHVARGELELTISPAADETGQVLAAMSDMVDTLRTFREAQRAMALAHERGDVDVRMPVDVFSGAYREMAVATNELIDANQAVTTCLVDVLKRYAEGDFTVDMPDLPGKRAEITHAAAQAKRALVQVSAAIAQLVDGAVVGDFSRRGEEAKFSNAFRDIVGNLNRLMAVADVGLGDVGAMLRALSIGDLTKRVDADYAGTFGRLKDDANLTAEQLAVMVERIRNAAQSIGTASGEIAAGNSNLSARTSEQALSLQETALSMTALTGTVNQNAENAKQANQLAESASEIAKKGGNVVTQVVRTMGSISESAKKIEDIISVIDGIAFQTNILALNAAVEAARAGEHGRGFAVVAAEVRSLAQRSATAAQEIKDLIGHSVSTVNAGSRLVNAAGETMDEVVKSVTRVADIISEISAASTEQSVGIEQVNQAISRMEEVTQQNAALVEQAATAAESMEEQARGLTGAVSVFRVLSSGDDRRSRNELEPLAANDGQTCRTGVMAA